MMRRRIVYPTFIVTTALTLVAGFSCAPDTMETFLTNTRNDLPATSTTSDKTHTSKITSVEEELFMTSNPLDGWLYYEWIIHGIELWPDIAGSGEKVDIWTNIYCSGNYESRAQAFLIINEEMIDSKAIVIPPDEDFPFVFSFSPDSPGIYDITVRIIPDKLNNQTDPFDTSCYHLDACATLTVEK